MQPLLLCAAASRRITRVRTSATTTTAATSASRIAVAPADSGMRAAATVQVPALTASQKARRQPTWTTAINGTARNKEQAKVRAAVYDEQRHERDQPTAPEIEQQSAAARGQPFAPRDHHRHGVPGGCGERRADQEPPVPRADVQRESCKNHGNGAPTEPIANLNGCKPEPELDTRFVLVSAYRLQAEARTQPVGATCSYVRLCKRPRAVLDWRPGNLTRDLDLALNDRGPVPSPDGVERRCYTL